MSKRKRLEYLIITSCVLLSGFVIYGFVGSIQPLINDSKVASFFVFGALGGFGFSLILSTIILSSRFFQNSLSEINIGEKKLYIFKDNYA